MLAIKELHDAGLSVSLLDSGFIAVTPASKLTDDLRALIRENKPLIIAALQAANEPEMPPYDLSRTTDDSQKNTANATSCNTCQVFKRPGLSGGYCSGREDLPLAYGINHPLRKLPSDHGADCQFWALR